MNPEIAIPVLDTIWLHFKDLYVDDDEVLPPLRFTVITSKVGQDVSLKVC